MKTGLAAFLFIFLVLLMVGAAIANPLNSAELENFTELAEQLGANPKGELRPINPLTNATAAAPVIDTEFAQSSAIITVTQEVKGRVTQEQAELIAEARGRAFFLQETAEALRNSAPVNAVWGNSGDPDDFLVIAEALFNIRAVNFELISIPGGQAVEVKIERSPRYTNLQQALQAGVADEDYLLLLGMALKHEIDKLKFIQEKMPEALQPAAGIPENVLPLKSSTSSLQAMVLFRENLRPIGDDSGPLLIDIDKNMNRAATLDPWSPLPFYLMGYAQLKMGNSAQAIVGLTEALNQRPNFAQALLQRGTAYLRLSLLDLALRDFDDAIKLRPNRASYYMARGSAYLAKKDFTPMCQDFESACLQGECEALHWGVSRGHCK